MKRICLLLFFACLTCISFSQPLFTFGNTPVDKSEFMRAYNKNKTPVADKAAAMREYLDLYIKFKLKVKAALELKLDTMPQLQYDAQSFRSQIEDSYLNNEKVVNELLKEAFYRSQKDLRVSHFFIPVAQGLKPDDTLKAFTSANVLYNALKTGKDHDKAVAESPVNIKESDLGFITVFSLPYEYESIIYALKTGETSRPYRGKNGWHLFKVTENRKAVGKWKIAQILFSFPPDATAEMKKEIEKKADSVHGLLIKGEDFGKMARWFSDDKNSSSNDGEMAEFGTGKFEPAFENEVFKLSRNKEISKPFLTAYGYHIVKRLSQGPVSEDINDMAFQYELKQNLQKDNRINLAKDLFVVEVIKQVGFKKTNLVSDAELFRLADTVIARPDAETDNARIFPITGKTICTFAKAKLTGKDWLDFVRSYKGSGELYKGENNTALLNKFITVSVMEYYKKHLEDYNADFRYQMEEFRDGNVLFEIMERNIWGKASADQEALQKFYDSNKSKYVWNASANIIIFTCSNKNFAGEAREALLKGKDWKKITEDSNNNIQADSGRYELKQLPIPIDANTPRGFVSEIVESPVDGNSSFIQLIDLYPANLQRNFEEAKGMVINDYQNILEDKWIAELKNKYPVKINEAVFQSLLK